MNNPLPMLALLVSNFAQFWEIGHKGLSNLLLGFAGNLGGVVWRCRHRCFIFLVPNIRNGLGILMSSGRVIRKYLCFEKLDRLLLICLILSVLLFEIFEGNSRRKIWIQGCWFAFCFYMFFLLISGSWNFQEH